MAEGPTAPRAATAGPARPSGTAATDGAIAPPEARVRGAPAVSSAAPGVAVAVTVAVALRARVIAGATLPVIMPDEGGTWSIARLVARVGPPIPMRDMPSYPLGTGVLLAPVVRLFDGPTARYRAALVVLALLAAAAAVLTALLIRRLGVEDRRALAAAFVVALLFPALTMTASFTWSEALGAAGLAGFLLAAHFAFVRVTGAAPVLAGALAGAMPFVHGRFTLVPVCWLVCLGIYLARAEQLERWARVWTWLLTLLATFVVFAVGRAAHAAVTTRLWSETPSPSTLVRDSLFEPTYWRQFARIFVGQAWYLVAASFGCALLGVLWLVAAIRAGTVRNSAARATVVLTGLVVAAVFVTSAATLASGTHEALAQGEPVRVDYLAYGRYIDPVVMVLAALGVATLFAVGDSGAVRRAVAAVVTTLAVLTGLVWVMLPDDRIPPFEPNIAGVVYLPLTSNKFDVVMWSIVSGVAFVAVVGASRLSGRWSVLALAVLFGAAAISASSMAMEVHDRWVTEVQDVVVPAPRPGRDVVVVAEDVERADAYQYGSMVQEYVLTADGWRFDFTPLTSAELRQRSPEVAGVMVLVREQPVDEDRWRLAGAIREARVWVRRDG